MEIYQKQSFKDSFKIYFDKRMIRILLLGIISGFPWVLIGSSLSLWLVGRLEIFAVLVLFLPSFWR